MIFTILSFFLSLQTLDQFIILCCDNETQLKLKHFWKKVTISFSFLLYETIYFVCYWIWTWPMPDMSHRPIVHSSFIMSHKKTVRCVIWIFLISPVQFFFWSSRGGKSRKLIHLRFPFNVFDTNQGSIYYICFS